MKSKVILLLLSLLLFQSGCDYLYVLKLDNKTAKEYSFDCGKSSLEIETIQWQDFRTYQKYYTNNPIVLFPDSLKIYLNSTEAKIIGKHISVNKKMTQAKQIIIKGSADVYIGFSLDGSMNDTDTLEIVFNSLAKCNKINAFQDTIRILKKRDYVKKGNE